MKILAIETATEACSAALSIDGNIVERYELKPRQHSRLILAMMDSLLNEAGEDLQQLDALAFGCGPGSFTGLRIAAGVIQGAALGADLPVIPVSTLAALGQDCLDRNDVNTVFTAIDARMGEVYWSVCNRNVQGLAEQIEPETVTPVDRIECADNACGIGIGSGWDTYQEKLTEKLGKRVSSVELGYFPRAAAVARLGLDGFDNGKAVPAEDALPVYLRNKVAKKKGE